MANVNVSVKSIIRAKRITVRILAHVFDDSVIVCDKRINVTKSESAKVTNTVLINICTNKFWW